MIDCSEFGKLGNSLHSLITSSNSSLTTGQYLFSTEELGCGDTISDYFFGRNSKRYKLLEMGELFYLDFLDFWKRLDSCNMLEELLYILDYWALLAENSRLRNN